MNTQQQNLMENLQIVNPIQEYKIHIIGKKEFEDTPDEDDDNTKDHDKDMEFPDDEDDDTDTDFDSDDGVDPDDDTSGGWE